MCVAIILWHTVLVCRWGLPPIFSAVRSSVPVVACNPHSCARAISSRASFFGPSSHGRSSASAESCPNSPHCGLQLSVLTSSWSLPTRQRSALCWARSPAPCAVSRCRVSGQLGASSAPQCRGGLQRHILPMPPANGSIQAICVQPRLGNRITPSHGVAFRKAEPYEQALARLASMTTLMSRVATPGGTRLGGHRRPRTTTLHLPKDGATKCISPFARRPWVGCKAPFRRRKRHCDAGPRKEKSIWAEATSRVGACPSGASQSDRA